MKKFKFVYYSSFWNRVFGITICNKSYAYNATGKWTMWSNLPLELGHDPVIQLKGNYAKV